MNRLKIRINAIPLVPFVIIALISLFALIGFYSMGSGNFYPWCAKQFLRLIIGFSAMTIAASIDTEFWRKHAYKFYLFCLSMLVGVAVIGKISMGAQRWLDLYFFNVQPSELMRMFLVIALAKYFSNISEDNVKKTKALIIPIALVAVPMALILLQPDLGTAILFFCLGVSVLFVCGVQIWKFIVALTVAAAFVPILWGKLYQYQQERILMFLNPEKDMNGAGYHVIQARISLGSGGLWGRGLMNGTQSALNFLPEKQTDFVFAAMGEELGFIGCLSLLLLYAMLFAYNLIATVRMKNKFNKIMVFSFNAVLFFYVFINTAMVCGLMPVVGIPLPFFSYGGSSLVVLMFCQGLIFAADFQQRTSRKKPLLK
ncbi:MAG: rod shape-determining protein RodA [Holosporales bacterium]|jgi:rod shape determining protein RodA|nr:rod shape-determining protein RodA [Holosporales bacterium]